MNGASCSLIWLQYNLRVLPDLMRDPACRALLRLINFSQRRDSLIHEERIIISYLTLARCDGQLTAALSKNYRGAVGLLKRIKAMLTRAGWRVEWNSPNYRWGQARALVALPPEEYAQMRRRELRGELEGERVLWSTGAKWTRRKAGEALKAAKEEAQQQIVKIGGAHAKRICAAHNDQSPNAFARLAEIAESLIPEAAKIEKPRRRDQALASLQAIRDCPQPIYVPVARSARIYETGMGMGTLPRQFRHRVYWLMGWVGVDGKNIQLAAFARICNAPKLLEFLRTPGSDFWGLMADHCQANLRRVKATLKRGTYGPCFGQNEFKARRVFRKLMMEEGYSRAEARRICEAFYGHPLMVELFQARAERIEWIKLQGWAETVTGERIEISLTRAAHKVLATLAQAVEQHLMAALYDVAEQSKGAIVIRHNLHDGLGIQIYDERRWQYWLDRLVRAYAERAAELGVPTVLNVEINPLDPVAVAEHKAEMAALAAASTPKVLEAPKPDIRFDSITPVWETIGQEKYEELMAEGMRRHLEERKKEEERLRRRAERARLRRPKEVVLPPGYRWGEDEEREEVNRYPF